MLCDFGALVGGGHACCVFDGFIYNCADKECSGLMAWVSFRLRDVIVGPNTVEFGVLMSWPSAMEA